METVTKTNLLVDGVPRTLNHKKLFQQLVKAECT